MAYRKYASDEERMEAIRRNRDKYQLKHARKINLDNETGALLDAKLNDLEDTFGFRPSMSQMLRHLLKQGEAK